jgi:hypothetical protein
MEMFVMRFSTAHSKGNVFDVRLVLAHGKGDNKLTGLTAGREKNICCAPT